MMNIQNLGAKESFVVKFKEGIYVKLCLALAWNQPVFL